MKIALIGYGKMGHMIESIALSRGNEITCRIDKENLTDFDSDAFRNSDVAIEFTTPATAAANIERCFAAGVPVVCGTTGWTERLPELQKLCAEDRGTLMWASNYSVGVNIFMAVNRFLAGLMQNFPDYTPSMTEVHHIHKLDHPSGTAITLAEQLIASDHRVTSWADKDGTEHGEGVLEIESVREGEVPGIHSIRWDSDVDDITITHSAKSRRGFALGAVLAAEWLPGHKGYHAFGEVLADMTKKDIFNS